MKCGESVRTGGTRGKVGTRTQANGRDFARAMMGDMLAGHRDGKTFWYNRLTKKSQWTCPPELRSLGASSEPMPDDQEPVRDSAERDGDNAGEIGSF